ncbi:HDOD domain-containing protein [Leeia sp.]|uniref:HDOD domain-containing protein n=1 Tax=Leeia sp. TaxID=2884678 RepID=UPI0035B48174
MTTAEPPDTLKAAEPYLTAWQPANLPMLQVTQDALRSAQVSTSASSPGALAAIVARDPFLTLQVLSYVNTIPRGSFASDITSLEHALMLLGVEQFYDRFSRRPVLERLLDKDPARLRLLQGRLSQCLLAGQLAREVARVRLDSKAEEVFLGALLHDVIEPLLLLTHPQRVAPIHWHSHANLMLSDPALQQQLLGLSYQALLQHYVGQIGMPYLLAGLMCDQQLDKPRNYSVQLAVQAARASLLGWWRAEYEEAAQLLAEFLKLSIAEWSARQQALLLQHARWNAFPDITLPAMWLPMQPGDWAEPPVAKPASMQLDLKILEQVTTQLKLAGERKADVGQIMTLLFKGLRLGLGLMRVALLTQDKATNQLKLRFAIGFADDHPLRHQAIGLSTPHLFTRLMGKTQSLFYGDSNRRNLQAYLPAPLRPEPERDWVAMSLWVRANPLGLLYADGGSTHPQLDADNYPHFKAVMLTALAALEGKGGPA